MDPFLLLLASPVLAFIPAVIGARKGRSSLGFYLFGLFLFIPAVIVALLISSDTEGLRRRETRHPGLRTHQPPRIAGQNETGSSQAGGRTATERIEDLHQLYVAGHLSADEFEARKTRILDSM